MKLSEKLRNLRISREITQEQASKEIGIAISSLRNYENEKIARIPKVEELIKLKKYYDVSYEYLLDENCPYVKIDDMYVRELSEENERLKAKLKEINQISRF